MLDLENSDLGCIKSLLKKVYLLLDEVIDFGQAFSLI